MGIAVYVPWPTSHVVVNKWAYIREGVLDCVFPEQEGRRDG